MPDPHCAEIVRDDSEFRRVALLEGMDLHRFVCVHGKSWVVGPRVEERGWQPSHAPAVCNYCGSPLVDGERRKHERCRAKASRTTAPKMRGWQPYRAAGYTRRCACGATTRRPRQEGWLWRWIKPGVTTDSMCPKCAAGGLITRQGAEPATALPPSAQTS